MIQINKKKFNNLLMKNRLFQYPLSNIKYYLYDIQYYLIYVLTFFHFMIIYIYK